MSIGTQQTDHLSTGDRWAAYNNPRRWMDDGIRQRPNFNVHKFQKKLNRIMGTSDGRPIVRLVWAWDVTRFEMGEIRQAYRFYTASLPNGDYCDLSPPRWIIEERYEPSQYMPSWEDARYVRIPVGSRFLGWHEDWWEWTENGWKRRDEPLKFPQWETVYEAADSLGPAPRDGLYSYLFTIADHDPDQSCCKRAWKRWKSGERKTMRCWGYYREPGQADLDRLATAKALRDAEPFKQSPFEPLTPETLSEVARGQRSWNEEQKEKAGEMSSDLWGSHMAVWGHRLETNDPSVLHHGKYKLPPKQHFGETESGLLVPKE
jgi:hypothetical protein